MKKTDNKQAILALFESSPRRALNALISELEAMQEESIFLRASLLHIAKGGKLDCVTGAPLDRVHLSVVGLGNVNTETVYDLYGDENDTTLDAFCASEACALMLRQFKVRIFGYGDLEESIQALAPVLHGDIRCALEIWRMSGAETGKPWQEWRKTSDAYKVASRIGQ